MKIKIPRTWAKLVGNDTDTPQPTPSVVPPVMSPTMLIRQPQNTAPSDEVDDYDPDDGGIIPQEIELEWSINPCEGCPLYTSNPGGFCDDCLRDGVQQIPYMCSICGFEGVEADMCMHEGSRVRWRQFHLGICDICASPAKREE